MMTLMGCWCSAMLALAPDFTLRVTPTHASQGSVVMVGVRSLSAQPLRAVTAHWKDVTAHATPWNHDEMLLFLPVKLEQAPGVHDVDVLVTTAPGVTHKATVRINVKAGVFDKDVLGVRKSFIQPNAKQLAQAASDAATFEALWKHMDATRAWQGPFALPINSAVTARFGTYRILNGKTRSRHMGLDLRGKKGDPIHAAHHGRVALVRNCFYSGNTVVVDHGNGIHTLYFHMTTPAVKVGQAVSQGQLLGTVGSTGRVTGPHLHWGVKVANVYVDPRALLALPLQEDAPGLAPAANVWQGVTPWDAGEHGSADAAGVPPPLVDMEPRQLMSLPEEDAPMDLPEGPGVPAP